MTIVVDASVVVAAFVDSGPDGQWALDQMRRSRLAAPHLMPVEVKSVLRRGELAGDLSSDSAALAHADVVDLPVKLFSYAPFAQRIWKLRKTVTSYDAWYVALADELDATLLTLDVRLSGAPGPRCRIEIPPS